MGDESCRFSGLGQCTDGYVECFAGAPLSTERLAAWIGGDMARGALTAMNS
jgi:hypothetical protein